MQLWFFNVANLVNAKQQLGARVTGRHNNTRIRPWPAHRNWLLLSSANTNTTNELESSLVFFPSWHRPLSISLSLSDIFGQRRKMIRVWCVSWTLIRFRTFPVRMSTRRSGCTPRTEAKITITSERPPVSLHKHMSCRVTTSDCQIYPPTRANHMASGNFQSRSHSQRLRLNANL